MTTVGSTHHCHRDYRNLLFHSSKPQRADKEKMMSIQALSLAIRRRPRRVVLAAVLAAATVYVGGSALALERDAANHIVEIHADFPLIPSLDALVRQSDVVVVAHVLEQGATHLVAQPTAQPQPFKPNPPPDVPAIKTAVAAGEDATAPTTHTVTEALPGVPVTTFKVQVDQVLRGSTPAGTRLSVIQTGGQITLPTFHGGPTLQRTLVLEGDPLLVPGQHEVLFLHRVGENGDSRDENGTNQDWASAYSIVGGPQGRFRVDNNTVTSLAGAPLASGHEGESLPSFAADIAAIGEGEHNHH
jgi:hypothetical protein